MQLPSLGVVIVLYNSADVILDCVESLLASRNVRLDVVLVDNASTDNTCQVIRDWAAGRVPFKPAPDVPFAIAGAAKPLSLLSAFPQSDGRAAGPGHRIVLLETGLNAGFAAGVNRGLTLLAGVTELDRFWILNPDSIARPETASAFAMQAEPAGGFGLMGGRVLYCPSDDVIQIDGGTINRKTGVTGNLHQHASHPATPAPHADQMDFITGASMVVSRRFQDHAGPMPEDYFLYYEEVDWAMRRGDLPIVYCPDAVVYHRAGTAIGSAGLGRPASPFSLYFKHRARMRFVRRYFPASLPMAYAYSLAKAAQLGLKGYPKEAATLLGATFGRPPAAEIRTRLSPEAAKRAFAGEPPLR